MNVYLTGFMGSGKTTVGKELAETCGLDFFDADLEIVKLLGTTIYDFVKKNGEPAFREKELVMLSALSKKSDAVIATGGGMLLQPGAREIIKNSGGTVVFLDTPFFECYRRIAGDISRPLAYGKSKAELNALYNERLKGYMAAADCTVRGGDTIENITGQIIKCLETEGE